MKKKFNHVAIVLLLAGSLHSCNEKEKCPVRVYTKQEMKPTAEQLKEYKPYIDIINSLGTFWIEHIERDRFNSIIIRCKQLINDILIHNTWRYPYWDPLPPTGEFYFLTGEFLESAKNGHPPFAVFEKGEFYFSMSNIYFESNPLPFIPKITPQEAIQAALENTEASYVKYCQYELCYWRILGETPRLAWRLHANTGGFVFIDALTGKSVFVLESD